MYESPIEFFTKTVAPKIAAEIDKQAIEAVFQCGFNVDRDELEKALRYDRDQWRKGFADGVEHAQPKWISVKDRLPEEGGKVLWFDRDDMEVGSVFRSRGATFVSTSFDIFDIAEYTHWMPLPEAPKEEDNANNSETRRLP